MNMSTGLRRALAFCAVLIWSGAASAWQIDAEAAALLREGGNVVLIRHATTVSGVGDPPGFRIDECATQRNLSDSGRDEARRLGVALRETGARFSQVRSSAWCRCVDTARLAFDVAPTVWQPLNSFFAGQGDGSVQTRAALAEARSVPAGENWVWVTHQVNISALTSVFPAMGEILITRPDAAGLKVLARWRQ